MSKSQDQWWLTLPAFEALDVSDLDPADCRLLDQEVRKIMAKEGVASRKDAELLLLGRMPERLAEADREVNRRIGLRVSRGARVACQRRG